LSSPQIFVIFQNFKRSPWIRPPQISTQIYATACYAIVQNAKDVEPLENSRARSKDECSVDTKQQRRFMSIVNHVQKIMESWMTIIFAVNFALFELEPDQAV
jgi:hypothetical protein